MAKVGVRKPLDEYQTAEKRSKAIMRSKARAPSRMPMPSEVAPEQARRAEGHPTKVPSDSPNVKKKIKGYSSEMM